MDTGTVSVNHKYTSQELDSETGLYYYGARYYDPVLGRFISPDTIIQDPSNPQDLNRYSYVANNPVNYTDPTGHSHQPGHAEQIGDGDYYGDGTFYIHGDASSSSSSSGSSDSGFDFGFDSGPAPLFFSFYGGGGGSGYSAYTPGESTVGSFSSFGYGNSSATTFPGTEWNRQGNIFLGRVDQGLWNLGTKFVQDGHNLRGLGVAVLQSLVPANTTEAAISATPFGFAGGIVTKGIGKLGLKELLNVLKPGGRLIGAAGSSSAIRKMSGGFDAAEKMFKELTVGGTVVKNPTYPGTLIKMEDGYIGLRKTSTSGPPTIDVNIEGVGISEIKF